MAIIGNIPYFQTNPYRYLVPLVVESCSVMFSDVQCRLTGPFGPHLVVKLGGLTEQPLSTWITGSFPDIIGFV